MLQGAAKDCPFCRRIGHSQFLVPPSEVRRAVRHHHPLVVMFAPLGPVTPGHMLFVPRYHEQNDASTIGVVMKAAASHAKAFQCDYNLILNQGPAASQTVEHLHVHYVPRTPDDGLKLPWTGQVVADD